MRGPGTTKRSVDRLELRGCWKIWTRVEFPRTGRRGTVRNSAPILSSCPAGTRRGNAEVALGTADLRDGPLPQGDSGFLEAPSFARRLAAGSFVFSSLGEAPANPGMRERGRAPIWWQLGGKVPAFPAVSPCSGSPLCCSLVQLCTFLMLGRRKVCSLSCGRLLVFVKRVKD